MRLKELRLKGFGKFTDYTLAFPGNFQIIIGPNEAGKSTLVDAVSGILFGFKRGQKDLRRRYQPWGNPDEYQASLTILTKDEHRYLIGRDFSHDRLEVFRGEGVRLEPVAEDELGRLLLEELGLNTLQLFESTLLIRQPEVSMVTRDRMAVNRVAEGLGRKIVGGDENATATQALAAINARLSAVKTGEGPGSLIELTANIASLEELLAKIEEGAHRYEVMNKEKARLEAGLKALEAERREIEELIKAGRTSLVHAETKNRILAEINEIQTQLAAVKARKPAEAVTPSPFMEERAVEIEPETMARAEELAGRIAELEVEWRYEEEAIRQFRTEIDLLEREIICTRAKLDALDTELLRPEIQSRLAELLPIVNENTARLGELFPHVDRMMNSLRRLKTVRTVLYLLCFLTAGGAIAAAEYRPLVEAWTAGGAAVLLYLINLGLVATSIGQRRKAKRLDLEIDRRESELNERRAEMEQLLQGRNPSLYQAELEASRLYQNDLWHLEQTLAQKRKELIPEKIRLLEDELAQAKQELEGICRAKGCRNMDELRAKAPMNPPGGDQPTAEEPGAGEQEGPSQAELEQRLAELQTQAQNLTSLPEGEPAGSDNEITEATARRDRLTEEIETIRLRLAELGVDLRNYREFVLVRDRFDVEEDLADARSRLAKHQLVSNGLALAARRIEEAVFEANTNLGPELQLHTGRILAEMTSGRYSEVQIDIGPAGLTIAVRAPETGKLTDPGLLSLGTIDQLYLALRLALAHQLTRGACFPLILDDPFASYDLQRLAETCRMLAHLSRDHQIIWFTKDGSLPGFIRETAGIEPSVVELSAPVLEGNERSPSAPALTADKIPPPVSE